MWGEQGIGGGGRDTRCLDHEVRPDLGSATLVFEFWLRNSSEPRLQLIRDDLLGKQRESTLEEKCLAGELPWGVG